MKPMPGMEPPRLLRRIPAESLLLAMCVICAAIALGGCDARPRPEGEGLGTQEEEPGQSASATGDSLPDETARSELQASLGQVMLGSKDSTEERIVAELYGLILEERGYSTGHKLGLADSAAAHRALLDGEIDVCPEYTTVALTEILGLELTDDAPEVVRTLRREYETAFGLTWLQPSPFVDTQALVTTQQVADELGLATVSDLATVASQLRLGAPASFFEAPDGLPALEEQYGRLRFGQQVELEEGPLGFDALVDGRVDVVVASSTDGRIAGDELVVLDDEKHVYPMRRIAPVVRLDVLSERPAIGNVLNLIAPLLTDQVMRQLNYEVQVQQRGHRDVAREFLTGLGLIGE